MVTPQRATPGLLGAGKCYQAATKGKVLDGHMAGFRRQFYTGQHGCIVLPAFADPSACPSAAHQKLTCWLSVRPASPTASTSSAQAPLLARCLRTLLFCPNEVLYPSCNIGIIIEQHGAHLAGYSVYSSDVGTPISFTSTWEKYQI